MFDYDFFNSHRHHLFCFSDSHPLFGIPSVLCSFPAQKTYEMHMFNSASMKLGLDRAVLAQQRATDEKGRSKRSSKEQAQEIDTLLKKGAYDVFRDDDDEEAKMFMEETDIDKLLERSAKKITYGTGNSSLSSGLGSFSKASFVASGEGEGKDVDLDDPNFWEKAVGLQPPPDPESDKLAQLMTDGKRHRKQVQQYDPYAVDKETELKKQEKLAELEREEEEENEIRREYCRGFIYSCPIVHPASLSRSLDLTSTLVVLTFVRINFISILYHPRSHKIPRAVGERGPKNKA